MDMLNGRRLSAITIAFGIYIVVSASFMLQVNLWLTEKIGNPFLYRAFWTATVLIVIASMIYALVSRMGIARIFAVISVFALAYILGSWQTYFEEKTHIMVYGLLGYLAARDLAGATRETGAKGALAALAFVAIVGASDEIFQWILPYRFGDVKDFTTNLLGGALGITLFLALDRRRGP